MSMISAPESAGPVPATRPLISIIMANWRGERYISDAISSVLRQSIRDIELLVADDASGDRSVEIVKTIMAQDSRVRILPSSINGGPSDARNRALDVARGEWVAIMDSDDLIHPRRLELMLEAARRTGADIVADDMAYFGDVPGVAGRTLLQSLHLTTMQTVGPAYFVESNTDGSKHPCLGYIKPLIRRATIADLRYDPKVRVGEDYDFYLRLLLKGAKLVLLPLPLYLYRRHAGSLSHRLSVRVLEPLIAAHVTATRIAPSEDGELKQALERRGHALARALRYEHLVEAVKSRSVGRSARLLLRDPILASYLARSLSERLGRRREQASPSEVTPAKVAMFPSGAPLPAPLRDGTSFDSAFDLGPVDLEHLHLAPKLVQSINQLTDIASRRPIVLTTVGLAGLDLLGLLPNWQSATVWVTDAEERDLEVHLPDHTEIERMPALP